MTTESHRRRAVDILGLRNAGRKRPEQRAKAASEKPIGAALLAGREALACPSQQRVRCYPVPYTSS